MVSEERSFFLEGEIGVETREAGHGPLPARGAPRRRITGKTSMMAVSVDEEQRRHHRGHSFANEEFKRFEKGLHSMDTFMIPSMDEENRFLENVTSEIRMKRMSLEEQVKGEKDQGLFLQPMKVERGSLLDNELSKKFGLLQDSQRSAQENTDLSWRRSRPKEPSRRRQGPDV